MNFEGNIEDLKNQCTSYAQLCNWTSGEIVRQVASVYVSQNVDVSLSSGHVKPHGDLLLKGDELQPCLAVHNTAL
jgi:hypothetical protein